MQNNEVQTIKTVPPHYTSVTPWIIACSSAGLIDFLQAAFDAEEIANSRIVNGDGKIIHAVVKIDEAMLMLFDSREDWAPTPSFLNLYVADIDKVQKKAITLGAKSVTAITELWFGEKVCRILDPFGNLWWINQRIEDIDFTNPEEIAQRASTPKAMEGIQYIQKSLDEAMSAQQDFFLRKQ